MKNTFVKVLSFMMALTMIVGAFGAITVSAVAAECAHEDRTEIAVVAPTCAVAGFTRYECNDCGEEFIDSIKPATGKHSWKNVAESKATCDEPGYAAHKICTVCEATDPANLNTIIVENALGHIFSIPCKKDPTCTEVGYTSLKCARCDAVSEDEDDYTEIPKVGHDYQYNVTTKPTDCVSGEITVTCSGCDYYNVIASKNTHTWKNMDVSKLTETADVAAVEKALADKGIEFGSTCGDDYEEGEICIVCLATQKTKPSAGTCNTFVVVGAADGYKVTAQNYKDAFATVDGKTFTVGSDTKVDPTHAAAGWQLVYCEDCKNYDVQILEKVAHAYTGTGASVIWIDAEGNEYADGAHDDAEYHTIAMTKYEVCACGDKKATSTTKASTKHDFDWKEGDVQKGTVVVAATCTANGFIHYDCELCDYEYDELTDLALGHDYGEWKYASTYTCGDTPANGQMERVCTRKYGDAACALEGYKETKKADANKTHAYAASVKTEATCVANAVYEWKCSDCGHVGTKPEDVTFPVSGVNSANHVVKATDTDSIVQANVVAATCTNKAKSRFICSCGELLDLEVGSKLDHTPISNKHAQGCTSVIVVNDDDGSIKFTTYGCVAGCKDYRVHAATCKTGAVTKAGTFCDECGADVTKPTVSAALNANNHLVEGSAAGAVENNATCVEKAYTLMYYSCCGGVKPVYSGEKDPNCHVNFLGQAGKEASMLTFVAKVPATCITEGTEAHYVCSGCKKIVTAVKIEGKTGETAADYQPGANDADNKANTIAKLSGTKGAHDFTVAANKVPAQAESCTAKGWVEYYTCKNAGCTYIKVAGKDPFVPSDGNDADTIYDQIEIAPHGTANMGWHQGVEPTCTTDGYWFKNESTTYSYDLKYCCSKCDRQTVTKTNHAGSDYEVINSKTGDDYDCTMPTYEFHLCPDCGYSFFMNYEQAPKTAHVFEKYTEGDKKGQDKPSVPGTPTCTEAAEDVYKCQNPNCDYQETRPGAAATGHKIKVNDVEIAVDFGCTSADHVTYKGFKCQNPGCGYELGVEAKYEHNIVTAKEKDPTCTTTGNTEFDYCVDCGKITRGTVTEIPATGHLNYELVEVVDGVAKYSCYDCGEFFTEDVVVLETTLSLENTLVAAGSEIKVAINATADALAFNQLYLYVYGATKIVNVELVYDFGAATHVDFTDYEFVIYTEHDVNGDPTFVTLDGEDVTLAIVTLKVDDLLYGSEFELEAGAYGAVVDFDEDGEVYAEVIDEYDYVEVQAVMAGELNGDGTVGVSDIQKLMNLVANGSTDAIADVNRDGEVDVFDIAALRTFASSNGSAYAYFTMMGADFAALAKKYAPDMNDDGYINDTDAKLFATYLEKNLANYDAYYMDVYGAMYELANASFGEVVLQGAADLVEFVSDYISENGVAPAISAIFGEVIEEYYDNWD